MSMRWNLIGVLIALCLVCGACSSEQVPQTSESELQQEFNTAANDRQRAWIDRVEECALHNGITVETTRQYYANLSSAEIAFDAPMTSEQVRAQIAEEGSRLVASIQNPGLLSDVSPGGGFSDIEIQVLETGPISAPNGDSYEQSCGAWALETVEGMPAFIAGIQREEAYAEFLEKFMEGSPELQELETEWIFCMTSAGFPDLQGLGGHLNGLRALRQQVRAGEVAYQSALQQDIRISLANFDCWTSIEGDERNRAIADAAVKAFLDQD